MIANKRIVEHTLLPPEPMWSNWVKSSGFLEYGAIRAAVPPSTCWIAGAKLEMDMNFNRLKEVLQKTQSNVPLLLLLGRQLPDLSPSSTLVQH